MQRLHEDDMSGFVLNNGMGEKFHHLKIPAIKEDGTALWPFKHTLEELLINKKTDARVFSGQYMQEPAPEDGTYFTRDMFRRYRLGTQPVELYNYQAADFAVSEGKGDFTEIGVAGFDSLENLYFLDWWSGQKTADVWIDKFIQMAKDYEPFVAVAENGLIRSSIEPFLKKRKQQKKVYFRMEWLSHKNKDKPANARSFQGLANDGKVYIPHCDWGDDLIEQLISFPGGKKHDDKVDVCGLFGRILDQTFAPSSFAGADIKNNDAYSEEDEESHDNAWIS
jgi:predicted phage terminase large subunit-like protein